MNSGLLKFVLDNKVVEIDFSREIFLPSTTVLNYLRSLPHHRGVKEGCAEGDCGACTVVLGELMPDNTITYKAVDSCLLFLPAIHGKQLITVENLAQHEGSSLILHPIQQAFVDQHGSQCGFCTPGFVMALFAFYKKGLPPTRQNLVDSLAGNLCRCTGYQPIIDAAVQCCEQRVHDHFDSNEKLVAGLLKNIRVLEPCLEIKTPAQHYMLPNKLDQALEWREKFPHATLISGATDTAIHQNKTHEFAPAYIDLSQVDEFKEIRLEEDGFFIGSGVSIERLREFSRIHLPVMLPILEVFASQQIRNVATFGGNLATASPIGDLIPMAFALKARMVLGDRHSRREVDAEDFITGYRSNCISPNEVLLGIFIPKMMDGIVFRAEKVSTRRDMDISAVFLAMRLELDQGQVVKQLILAYGGMAAFTKRAHITERFITGKPWNEEVLLQAGALLAEDFTPISDARGGSDFRIQVARGLLMKMLPASSGQHQKELAYES